MSTSSNTTGNKNNNDLWRYAGLASQVFVSIGLAVFIGYKVDKWLHFSFPVLVWALPLIVLFSLIYKIIKDTGKRK